MKQIVDKLNKIAKKINENVELSDRDLIIDSLDSITKAYGGTPNDSTLIVDKLDDIYNNIGPAVSGNIEITENGENINVAPYATATVNVSGGGGDLSLATITVNAAAGSYPPTSEIVGAIAIEAEEGIPAASYRYSPKVTAGTNTFKVILYKGLASVEIPLKVVSMTGAIVNTDNIYYNISGDCVLNVEPGEPAPPSN